MLQNLGLVLLTAAEPKTGQSQTGMGSLGGVEEEKEEAGGSTIVCNEASPFSCDETVTSSCPKRRVDYLSLKGSPSTGRNPPRMGRNSLSISMAGFPCALHSPDVRWLKQRLREYEALWECGSRKGLGHSSGWGCE